MASDLVRNTRLHCDGMGEHQGLPGSIDTLYGAKDRAELVAACRGCVGLRGGDNDRNRTKAGGSRGRVAPLPESEVEDTQVSYL